MANNFYVASGYPAPSAPGASLNARTEFANISAGFDKMPTLTGTQGQIWRTNASGTAGETVDLATAVAGVGFETTAHASATYLPIATAASTYLTIATAASTYLTPAAASAAYLGIGANAVSATKLVTARTINGVNFDGTGNITINAVDATPRVAKAGDTMSGALSITVTTPGSQPFSAVNSGATTSFYAANFSNGSDADFNVQLSGVGAGTKFASVGPSVSVPLIFVTASSERMRIDGSGNVGIGVAASGAKLDVYGGYSRFRNGTFSGYLGAGSSLLSGAATSDLALYCDVGNLLFGTGASAERMRIDSSGNVGIGRTSGGNKLEVQGNIFAIGPVSTDVNIVANSAGSAAFVAGVNASASANGYGAPAGTSYSGGTGSIPHVFLVASVEKMRLDASGNLGLGTTSPGAQLHVSNGHAFFGGNGTTHPYGGLYLGWNASGGTGESNFVNQYGGGTGGFNWQQTTTANVRTTLMTLDASGNLLVGSAPTSRLGVGAITDTSNVMQVNSKGSGGATTLSLNCSGLEAFQMVCNQSGSTYQGIPTGAVGLTNVSGQAIVFATGVERMRVHTNGYLGIGQSTPSVPLHLSNAGVFESGNWYALAYLNETGSGNQKGICLGYDNTAQLGIVAATSAGPNSGLSFWTYNSGWGERMRISTSGVIQDGAGLELGFKGTPSASVTTGAFTAADRGKIVWATGGVTIPNATMGDGDIVVIQDTTGSAQTITASITTLRQTGTTNTGSRTLKAWGRCVVSFKGAASVLAFIGGDVT